MAERENLFTKKTEKTFFQLARDEADAEGKVAVLLKGFDNSEKNLVLDDRAMKIKNASKEHTIIVRLSSHSHIVQRVLGSVQMCGPSRPGPTPRSRGPSIFMLTCTHGRQMSCMSHRSIVSSFRVTVYTVYQFVRV